MPVIIRNISDHDGSSLPSRYTVHINSGPVLASFEHNRGDGLAICLRRAADAVEATGPLNPFASALASPAPDVVAEIVEAIREEARRKLESANKTSGQLAIWLENDSDLLNYIAEEISRRFGSKP